MRGLSDAFREHETACLRCSGGSLAIRLHPGCEGRVLEVMRTESASESDRNNPSRLTVIFRRTESSDQPNDVGHYAPTLKETAIGPLKCEVGRPNTERSRRT